MTTRELETAYVRDAIRQRRARLRNERAVARRRPLLAEIAALELDLQRLEGGPAARENRIQYQPTFGNLDTE